MSSSLRGRIVAFVGVGAVALFAGTALFAQGPGGPRGPGGEQRQMPGAFQAYGAQLMVERAVHGSWAFVALELGVSDEKLIDLRTVYQKNWQATKASIASLEDAEPDARRDIMQGIMESQRELRQSVKGVLSAEEGVKLDAWYDEQRQQSMRGGGRGGPGGPGGEGGGQNRDGGARR